MKKILNNEFASISFDETSNSIITVWKRPTTSDSYRNVFTLAVESLIKYKADSFISDIFHQGIVGTENRLWLQNEILPKAYKGGLRKVATIAPNDVFSRFYVESVKNDEFYHSIDLEFRYFPDLISAQSWILNREIPV